MIPIEKIGAIRAPGGPDLGRRQERLELLVDLAEDLVDPLFDAGSVWSHWLASSKTRPTTR
ncbi:hypothetical protein C2855_03740 [Aeromonas bestiarum]|nr:hypothetical protein C2855_03740 [Aeromonas bestiarum]